MYSTQCTHGTVAHSRPKSTHITDRQTEIGRHSKTVRLKDTDNRTDSKIDRPTQIDREIDRKTVIDKGSPEFISSVPILRPARPGLLHDNSNRGNMEPMNI